MSDQYIGEIRPFSFPFAPKGWALCNGQVLPIQQNQALYAILGVAFGGDGTTTFGLPNLQGGTPVHLGGGIAWGQTAGEVNHTLSQSEMPQHSHTLSASNTPSDTNVPAGNLLGSGGTGITPYAASSANTTLIPSSVSNQGGGQAHSNLQPSTVISMCIALTGIFPSRG